jgi:hypothetical protein
MTDIHMGARRRRWVVRIIALIVLACVIASVVPTIRMRFLRAAGWALVVHRQPVQSADIIVIAIDTDGAGTLEAADLIHGGISTRVAIFTDPPDEMDREFIRRGIPYEDAAAVSARQLRSLGVQNIEQIPRSVAGSEEEGDMLPVWCDQHHFRSVVVVTTPDHSRRLHRILARSMQGHQTSVTVQPTRYSTFDPDHWWETRGGTRTEIIELEKLLLDIARHPIS